MGEEVFVFLKGGVRLHRPQGDGATRTLAEEGKRGAVLFFPFASRSLHVSLSLSLSLESCLRVPEADTESFGNDRARERTIATNFYIDRVECRLELALQGDELITTGNRDSYFFVILLNEGGMLSLFEEFWRCSRFTLCCTSDVTQHVTESSRITTRNLFFPWKNWNGKIIGAQTLRRVYSRKEQREREKRRRKVSRGLESRRRRMSGSYFNPWLSFEVPPPGSSSPWSHDEWSGLGFF